MQKLTKVRPTHVQYEPKKITKNTTNLGKTTNLLRFAVWVEWSVFMCSFDYEQLKVLTTNSKKGAFLMNWSDEWKVFFFGCDRVVMSLTPDNLVAKALLILLGLLKSYLTWDHQLITSKLYHDDSHNLTCTLQNENG